jgi:hypothetical protein
MFLHVRHPFEGSSRSFGVPYGSRTRVAVVKEKRPMVIHGNLAAWIALYALEGLTERLLGLLVDSGRGCISRTRVRQIASPTSPSSTDVFSCGCSPLFHSAAVCKTRYLMGPPSDLSLRAMGRGMQTNSVRISSADNWTFA